MIFQYLMVPGDHRNPQSLKISGVGALHDSSSGFSALLVSHTFK